MKNLLFAISLLLLWQGSAFAWHLGVGYSTITSGRQIPALSAGFDLTRNWALSGMVAGAQTKAYYASGYMTNLMYTTDWPKVWALKLETGFGGGFYYAKKGIYRNVDEDGQLANLQEDEDMVVGPAFRVGLKPVSWISIAVEFVMGFGSGAVVGAWSDAGIGAIEVEF